MQQNPNLFAGLGPFAGLTQAATELTSGGIRSLFGIKDPEIEARNAIAMAAQNPNDPATLQAAAQALAQAGKIDQAMALAGQARQIQEKERSFGLEQRRVAATEEQIAQGDERIRLAEEDLQLKRDKLEQDKTLTDVQVKKAKAELTSLEKDYTPSLYKDNAGNALFNKRGEVGLFYFDESTNTIKGHKSSQGLTTIKPPSALNPLDAAIAARMSGQQPPGQQPPLAVTGQPQGQAGGSFAALQERAKQALLDRSK